MAQRRQPLQQSPCEVADAPVDRRHPDRSYMPQADLDRGQPEIVDRPVLEATFAIDERVALHCHRGQADRSAGEPGSSQSGQRLAAHDQRADPGRVAEDLVPGDRDKVRVPAGQVELSRRHERGCVDQDVPASVVRLGQPVERVPNSRVIGLGREREQVVPVVGPAIERSEDIDGVNAQARGLQGQVDDVSAPRTGELTDACDRVVVVGGQEEGAAPGERIRLPDELERTTGVGGENDRVLVRRGVEEVQDGAPRTVGELRGGAGRGVVRVRVPEDPGAKQLLVLVELRLGVEAATGVVEVDLVLRIESCVLARPQGFDGIGVPGGIGGRRHGLESRDCRQHVIGQIGHAPSITVSARDLQQPKFQRGRRLADTGDGRSRNCRALG